MDGKPVYVHRFVYEQVHHVKLGPKDFVCHSCDNPSCFNIDHLFLGNDRTNTDDKVSKGRQARGFMLPNTRLSDDDVASIRAARKAGARNKDLAVQYGVNPSHISKITTGDRRVTSEG